MKNIYFLDLPVYRIPQKRYNSERQEYIVKTICGALIPVSDMSMGQKDNYERHRPFLAEHYGGDWEFNEIVGFIKLHFLGSQVRGEYFTTKPGRKVKTRKKQFIYSTHKLAPEVHLGPSPSNEEIYKKVLEYVERCKQELPARYIEDKHLHHIGPYLNWVSLYRRLKNAG